MLVCKLDVDDVIARFSGTVGDLAGAVFLILSVNVYFAGSLNGQAQATIACTGVVRNLKSGRKMKCSQLYHQGDMVRTCITSVNNELSRLKGPGLAQTLAAHTHAASITDL